MVHQKFQNIFTNTNYNLLRFFLGVVFVSAGIYRIFNIDHGFQEIAYFGFSGKFAIIMIIFIILLEIIFGIFLLLNKYLKITIISLMFFLIIAFFILILRNFNFIWENLSELFIFNPTPTDIVLHICFFIMLMMLYNSYKNNK